MTRWRNEAFPVCPKSLKDFGNQLSEEQNQLLLRYDKGCLESKVLMDANGGYHIVFFDRKYIEEKMSDCDFACFDGTFDSTPNFLIDVYQLLTMMGTFCGHVS